MRRTLAAVTGLLAVVSGVGPARATAYTYQIFNYSDIVPSTAPLGGSLEFTGINDAGQIVGNYNSGPIAPRGGGLYQNSYAFSYNAGNFNLITGPGATYGLGPTSSLDGTTALAINNKGQILTGTSAGYFLDSNGVFTSLPVPTSASLGYPSQQSARSYGIFGINDLGDYVGDFQILQSNGAYDSIPISYVNGKFSIVNFQPYDPGYVSSPSYDHLAYAIGINDAGEVIGSGGTTTTFANGFSSPSSIGVLNNGGVVSPIFAPDGSGGIASLSGISNSGLITGTFEIETGYLKFIELSFVDDNGVFSTLDVPSVVPSYGYLPRLTATGINDQGDVVGYIVDATGQHAFLATPVPEPASITLLGAGLAALGVATRRRRLGS